MERFRDGRLRDKHPVARRPSPATTASHPARRAPRTPLRIQQLTRASRSPATTQANIGSSAKRQDLRAAACHVRPTPGTSTPGSRPAPPVADHAVLVQHSPGPAEAEAPARTTPGQRGIAPGKPTAHWADCPILLASRQPRGRQPRSPGQARGRDPRAQGQARGRNSPPSGQARQPSVREKPLDAHRPHRDSLPGADIWHPDRPVSANPTGSAHAPTIGRGSRRRLALRKSTTKRFGPNTPPARPATIQRERGSACWKFPNGHRVRTSTGVLTKNCYRNLARTALRANLATLRQNSATLGGA